jgi:hypothetical protein
VRGTLSNGKLQTVVRWQATLESEGTGQNTLAIRLPLHQWLWTAMDGGNAGNCLQQFRPR